MLGAALAEALGDRAGIRRFGDASVPMDESVATAVIDVGGRPYAVIDLPFRGERAGTLPLQLVEHALESFARTAGATLHLRGTGRNDHHLAEAAFKALAGRSASPASRTRGGPASRPPRARSDDRRPPAPSVAVVDYGAGNLVSIEQALTAAGARVHRAVGATRSASRTCSSSRASGRRRRRWTGCGAGGFVEPIRDWIAADRPFLGICLGLQLLFEGSRRGRRGDARRPARPHGPARRRPDAAAHRLEPGRAPPRPPGVRRASPPDADFYFVHSYVGRPGPRPADARPRRDRARHPVRRPPSPAAACSASSSTRSGPAPTGCGWSPTSWRSPPEPRTASAA